MKKIVSLLAAAAVFASASAFAKKVNLTVWESDGSEKAYIEWAIKEYKKTHKNVKIKYEPVSSTDARSKIELDGLLKMLLATREKFTVTHLQLKLIVFFITRT